MGENEKNKKIKISEKKWKKKEKSGEKWEKMKT
jgi:hypothetical protein